MFTNGPLRVGVVAETEGYYLGYCQSGVDGLGAPLQRAPGSKAEAYIAMPTGTPIWHKCPKCRRGKWGFSKPELGTRVVGNGIRCVRSQTSGFGGGGLGFYGYPGLVRCLDCGHEWFSTLPSSGRVNHRDAHPEEP